MARIRALPEAHAGVSLSGSAERQGKVRNASFALSLALAVEGRSMVRPSVDACACSNLSTTGYAPTAAAAANRASPSGAGPLAAAAAAGRKRTRDADSTFLSTDRLNMARKLMRGLIPYYGIGLQDSDNAKVKEALAELKRHFEANGDEVFNVAAVLIDKQFNTGGQGPTANLLDVQAVCEFFCTESVETILKHARRTFYYATLDTLNSETPSSFPFRYTDPKPIHSNSSEVAQDAKLRLSTVRPSLTKEMNRLLVTLEDTAHKVLEAVSSADVEELSNEQRTAVERCAAMLQDILLRGDARTPVAPGQPPPLHPSSTGSGVGAGSAGALGAFAAGTSASALPMTPSMYQPVPAMMTAAVNSSLLQRQHHQNATHANWLALSHQLHGSLGTPNNFNINAASAAMAPSAPGANIVAASSSSSNVSSAASAGDRASSRNPVPSSASTTTATEMVPSSSQQTTAALLISNAAEHRRNAQTTHENQRPLQHALPPGFFSQPYVFPRHLASHEQLAAAHAAMAHGQLAAAHAAMAHGVPGQVDQGNLPNPEAALLPGIPAGQGAPDQMQLDQFYRFFDAAAERKNNR
ncbi:Hypothetical Protein FCC1311_027072 [Hondaea fermentalgiana]|uniref:Uncharacterized protein n=1 Tax=Hondaea fermentalgiana TaxID=2315210 RepID=A0A2R5G615_9STRA|nr:Hypothetical Protein FCC1311_027072 [Hondaea fermentalgiana]|eukprot:GBG26486.1 Hypothetical Protein FCC1311_027072 [Hondaea fermentalgiana]